MYVALALGGIGGETRDNGGGFVTDVTLGALYTMFKTL